MFRRLACLCLLAGAALSVACGGGSPSSPSPSSAASVAIRGVVLGVSGSAGPLTASAAGTQAAGGSTITVTVEGTGLTTTVSASGTFSIEGVPGGTFTLIVKKDGVEIGRVEITAAAGSEVKITLQIQSSTLVVVEIKVEAPAGASPSPTASACGISGGRVGAGIELEGDVDSGTSAGFQMRVNGERSSVLVGIVTSAATGFKCNGGAKLTDAQCKAAVTGGAKVHVSGRLDTCDAGGTTVSASQVMVQK
jgi:hypothetical protein